MLSTFTLDSLKALNLFSISSQQLPFTSDAVDHYNQLMTVGGVGAKWAKTRPILTLMNFSKKQQCPVNVFLPLNMHHELSEQNKIAQFYSDEMSKLR